MASCYCASLFCGILQHQSLSTLQNWKKHGSTSLLTAVHHPPLDTTLWMDISRNPGPISEINSNGWDQVQGFNSHDPAQAKRTTILNNGPGMLLNIPSIVPMQPRHTFGYCRPFHGTPCNLKARSIKSKYAGSLCYVQSCAKDIFVITKNWFTERDSTHRVEVTPPGYRILVKSN